MSEFNFDPKANYSTTLVELKAGFMDRWNQCEPSEQIGLSKYDIKGSICTGSFGKVMLIKEKGGSAVYAAKVLQKSEIFMKNQVKNAINEKRILHAVRFPFCISLVASYKDNEFLYLIMPLLQGGELYTHLCRHRKFTESVARFYASQVFLALEYLHYCNILYRDLKPENILLDHRGYLKLIDFGFSEIVVKRALGFYGTMEYLAPEIVSSLPYGLDIDWWSFGVLIFELVSGRTPFSEHVHQRNLIYEKISEAKYKMVSRFTKGLKDLIHGLLQKEPTRRLGHFSDSEIKSHRWFRKVNWPQIMMRTVPAPIIPIIRDSEDLSNFAKMPNFKFTPRSQINLHESEFADF